jgi:hypothetical protein
MSGTNLATLRMAAAVDARPLLNVTARSSNRTPAKPAACAHVQQLRAELLSSTRPVKSSWPLTARTRSRARAGSLRREEATLAEALRAVAGDAPVRLLIKPVLSLHMHRPRGRAA